ncbi:MAG: NADH-quinone oxidoreductase subunit J [Bacteroides sp.]|nr:NADH-quinone oxidoreductase subunit J [Bacteroides sp.]
MYLIIALSIIVFSVLTVTTRKILRSATFLLFALFATAALYFKLDYEFLGAVQIAVYAGGIVVLFVFSILLTSHPGHNSEHLVSKQRLLGATAAILTFAVTAFALLYRCGQALVKLPAMENPKMHTLGQALMGSDKFQYLLPFEAVSILLLACIIGGVVIARKR